MADTTHRLKLKADAREVKVLGQEFQKAFDTKSPRSYQRELSGLQRRLKDVTSVQADLVKKLGKTADGTKEFKKLQDQLKLVGREARTVQSAIGSMTTAYRDFNAERKRGFAAGMAQGLGVAQYIPSEAGMGRRMAGAMIGQGIRRAGGAMMAPINQPGVGGMAAMLGAIPLVGQMASGQIQALAGMYQEAVAYQSQARGALFAQGRGFSPSEMKARRARGEILVGQEQARGQYMLSIAKRVNEETRARESRAGKRLAKEQQTQGSVPWYARSGREAASRAARTSAAVVDAIDAELLAEGPPSLAAQGGRRLPLAERTDPALIKQETRDRIRTIRARARAQPTGLPGMGAGVRFGFGPKEMMGQFTQFMQARGGTYDDVRQTQFIQQLAATTMGVSAGMAGQYSRMGAAGGGGMGSADLATALSSARALDLRGSQIPEYLQQLVSLGQEAERSGVKIDERSMTRQAALLHTVGLRGSQIARVTTGLSRSAMQLSQRGVSSPSDMLMLRAFGYDPSQGPEGYAKAMLAMEGGMGPQQLNRLMGMLVGAGSSGPMGALELKRFFGGRGTPISGQMATQMIDAYQNGKLGREYVDKLNRTMDKTDRMGTHQALVKYAAGKVGRGAPVTIAEAGMEAQRISLGIKMTGTMENLNTASINAAKAVANFSGQLKTISGLMATITAKIERMTRAISEGKGMSSIITEVMK